MFDFSLFPKQSCEMQRPQRYFLGQVDVSPMIKLGFALPPNVEIFEFLHEGF